MERSSESITSRKKVLIADDNATSRMVLSRLLNQWGYDWIEASDGSSALEILCRRTPPRIAVLDWMMPGLNGIEICKHLLARHHAPFVYTILLTAKSQEEGMVEALESGAHDFHTKPIEPASFKSRLTVAERLVDADDRLKQYAKEMETLAEARAKQLIHSDRLATLGTLSAGIAHEINNPSTNISVSMKTLQNYWKFLGPVIDEVINSNPDYLKKLTIIKDSIPDIIVSVENGVQRISSIVKGLTAYARKDGQEKKPCNIDTCINDSLQLCHNFLKKSIEVQLNLCTDPHDILANKQQIEQVLVNLIKNAADAMNENDGGKLLIKTNSLSIENNNYIQIIVCDDGPGIPKNKWDQVLNPFFTTKEPGKGTGLGLSIANGIVEEHNGTLTIDESELGGAALIFTIPYTIDPSPNSLQRR